MSDQWMELHGEYPHDPADDFCQECGRPKIKGECSTQGCKNQTKAYCGECGERVDVDELQPDPWPSNTWRICKKCHQATASAMGSGICENPIHNAEGGDIICPDCGKAV